MKCDHGKMPFDMGQLHGRVVAKCSSMWDYKERALVRDLMVSLPTLKVKLISSHGNAHHSSITYILADYFPESLDCTWSCRPIQSIHGVLAQ